MDPGSYFTRYNRARNHFEQLGEGEFNDAMDIDGTQPASSSSVRILSHSLFLSHTLSQCCYPPA